MRYNEAVPAAHGRCRPAGRLAFFLLLILAAPLAWGQQVRVSAEDSQAGESPADDGRFVLRRNGGNAFATPTVDYEVSGTATNGEDYALLSGSVTFGIFQGEAEVLVQVPGDDGLFEGDETVTITLLEGDDYDVNNSQDEATVTIADSAHAVTVASNRDADENAGTTGRFVVSLGAENRSGQALVVEYDVGGTASAGADYATPDGALEIPTGASSATIEIVPIDDELVEDRETVSVTLTGTSDERAPVGEPATATLSIVDDDSSADDDGDGLSNSVECPGDGACRDTDDDGTPDFQDPDDDGDGVPTLSENAPAQDTDDDGIPDYLDDNDDGDSRLTRDEDANTDGDGDPSTNPTDLDGDGVADYLDPQDQGGPSGDLDGDGLSNQEEEELGTDRLLADTDGDGVSDGAEVDDDTDPLDRTSFADADDDLVPDAVEAAEDTDPNDASAFPDTDRGGTPDHVETVSFESFGLPPGDPLDPSDDRRDTDGDGLPDRLEIAAGFAPGDGDDPAANGGGDDSGNGVTNAVESWLAMLGIENVDRFSDFDRDGYPDAREIALELDPLRAAARDEDGDGVPDVVELQAGSDIDGSTDVDMDGVPDAREIALGSDPLDANSPVANGNLDDDGDGLRNGREEALRLIGAAEDADAGTDTDGDGLTDGDEIRLGTDPLHDDQPVVWLELRQAAFGPVRALGTEGGRATAAAVVGGHQAGTLSYDWSGSDNAILAVASGGRASRTLSFEPGTLPPGHYDLVVRVQRTAGDFSSPASVVQLTVEVRSDVERADLADADQDGVPDASDDRDARNGFPNRLPVTAGELAADPGVRLQIGSTARATRSGSASVTTGDIAEAGDGSGGSVGNAEDEFEFRGGIVDFEIGNLPEAGAVVRVVIPQTAPIGELPSLRKFRPGPGWSDFVEDGNNGVDSAPGSGGSCPPPDDAAWQSGLTPGHACVRLTIEDGGPNDGDAADGPNGVIRDPSGVGTPEGEVVAGQGGGSAGLLALVVLAMTVATVALGRRRAAAAGTALAVVALCLNPPTAQADGFVGVGVGLSNLDPDTRGTPFSVADDQDTGLKAFAGFDLTTISPHLSVEAFYADLGQATLENRGTLDYAAYGAGLSFGFSGSVAPKFSAFVEGGIARLDIDADIPFSQEQDTSLFFGLAGSYAIRRHWYLQLEYEYFAEDAQLLSLSIVKRFRRGTSKAKTIPLPESRPQPGEDLDQPSSSGRTSVNY